MLGQLGRHIEMRIMVPRYQLEAAENLLFAKPIVESVADEDEAFADPDEEDDDGQSAMELAAMAQYRRPGYALWLAFLIPLGTGHLYARELSLATLLGAVELGILLGFIASGDPRWLILLAAGMFIDGVGGYLAALRSNQRLELRPIPPQPTHPYRRAFRRDRSHALPAAEESAESA